MSINQFIDPSNHPVLIEPIDLHKIKADAGSQLTSKEFQEAYYLPHSVTMLYFMQL